MESSKKISQKGSRKTQRRRERRRTQKCQKRLAYLSAKTSLSMKDIYEMAQLQSRCSFKPKTNPYTRYTKTQGHAPPRGPNKHYHTRKKAAPSLWLGKQGEKTRIKAYKEEEDSDGNWKDVLHLSRQDSNEEPVVKNRNILLAELLQKVSKKGATPSPLPSRQGRMTTARTTRRRPNLTLSLAGRVRKKSKKSRRSKK